MIITEDNFIWLNVTNKAEDIFEVFDLFILYDDESESLITNRKELLTALDSGYTIVIEVGQL
jgi:hypothetical protein